MNHPRRNVFEEIARIAAAGFDFIDLTIEEPATAPARSDWPAVRRAVEEAGLAVVAHAAPYLPLDNPSPLVRQAALDELRRTLDAAATLGAPLCTTHFVGWPAFLEEDAGYEFYRQALTILLRHGAEQGVQVTLENGADNRHQLKYFREIFYRLPDLRLTFDIGHGNIKTARSMTRDYLFTLNDRLRHVHISDNDGTSDGHLPFGAATGGGINLTHELRTLRSFNYDGTITLQVFGHERWLHASAELLRARWKEAG